jgi:hypothetical protein
MSQPSLQSFKSRGLILKAEVTEGTDSVPVVGTNGILLMNGKSGTEFDKKERVIDRAFYTNNPFTVGNYADYSRDYPKCAVIALAAEKCRHK